MAQETMSGIFTHFVIYLTLFDIMGNSVAATLQPEEVDMIEQRNAKIKA